MTADSVYNNNGFPAAQNRFRPPRRERKSFLTGTLLCLFCLTAQTAAQNDWSTAFDNTPTNNGSTTPAKNAAAPSADNTSTTPAKTAATPSAKNTIAPVTDTAKSFDAIFMEKYGKGAADSLVAIVKNDYLVCVGDPEKIGRSQLFRWKSHIDSMVRDKGYPQKFKSFVTATGMKAHEVRPCEPIVFYEQIDRQIAEMDNIISAQRAAKEKNYKDSTAIAAELKNNPASHVDILGIPTGISKNTLKKILERDKVNSKTVQDYILADSLIIDGQKVTAAFYFDASGRYNAYELETAAVKAASIDLVRKWTNEFAASYERKLGKPPAAVNRVNFQEIRQGRLSIVSRWDKQTPKVLIGLATDNNLYYAKVMVNY
jgi:hypothetical protein